MPLIAVPFAVLAFALLTTGHGFMAVGLLVACLLFVRGGYPLAWMGIALSGATGIRIAGGLLVVSDLFLVPALAIAVVRLLHQGRSRPRIPTALGAFAAAFTLLTGIEFFFGGISSLQAEYALRMVVIILGLPLIFLVHGNTVRRFDGLLGAYVLSAAASGFLATLDARGLHYASRWTGQTGYVHSGRFTGLADQPNQLGMICVLAIPMLVYLGRKHRAWYITAPVILAGLLASGSRGALLGVPIAFMALTFCQRQRRMRTIVGFGALGIVGLLIAEALGLTVGLDRLFQGGRSATGSDTNRLERASIAIGQIEHRPLFGYGFGRPSAHNTYLEVIRDGGIFVAIALFVVIGWAFVSCYRTRTALGVAPAASVLTWALLSSQFNGIYERYLWVPFGAAVAIVMMARSGTTPTEPTGTEGPAAGDSERERRRELSTVPTGRSEVDSRRRAA